MASAKRSQKGKRGYLKYKQEGRLEKNKMRKARKEDRNNVKLAKAGKGPHSILALAKVKAKKEAKA